jgi:RnfABCDGE-type electron transport complex D subunit
MAEQKTSSHLDVLTQKNLLIFTCALAFLMIGALIIFGWNVLLVVAVSYVVAFIVEYAFAKFRKRPIDRAWFVTPMVFALLMPPTAPWWMVMIGSFFGVFFGKAVFGGLGKNVFNPAIVGALFLTISFPNEMLTQWLNPSTGIISTSTPLIALNRGVGFDYSLMDLMIGMVPGTIGETFRIAIIALGVLLILMKIVDWRIPLAFIGSVFLITLLGNFIDPVTFKDPVYSIFVGGLMFGAFFVATDPVTAPIRPWGRVIYGVGLGVITVIIRNFAAFPEGVIFAIIIMNATSGLIDNWKQPKESNEKEVEA